MKNILSSNVFDIFGLFSQYFRAQKMNIGTFNFLGAVSLIRYESSFESGETRYIKKIQRGF